MLVKWIVFDNGGVLELVDDDQWPLQRLDRWAQQAGLDPADAAERLGGAQLPRVDIQADTETACVGRAGGIRTRGLLLPKQAR